MPLSFEPEPPPLRLDPSGAVRVGETPVTLEVVVGRFLQGQAPREIVAQCPPLTLADVYGTIFYYLRHRAEVDAFLQETARQSEALRQSMESTPERQEIIDRLRALARAKGLDV